MHPKCETTEIWCYSNPSCGRNIRMPPRSASSVQKDSGLESKGLVLLLICGIYAIFLFVIARLCSYMVSRLTGSVKSAKWRVETSQGVLTELTDANNNNKSGLKLKFQRLQPRTRTISHG